MRDEWEDGDRLADALEVRLSDVEQDQLREYFAGMPEVACEFTPLADVSPLPPRLVLPLRMSPMQPPDQPPTR
jgi:hypothetical protein